MILKCSACLVSLDWPISLLVGILKHWHSHRRPRGSGQNTYTQCASLQRALRLQADQKWRTMPSSLCVNSLLICVFQISKPYRLSDDRKTSPSGKRVCDWPGCRNDGGILPWEFQQAHCC